MKSEYEIQLSSSSVFKKETYLQIINSMEKLENVNSDILGNINKNILEKRNRLENLHSRIIRINKILALLENIPQALTLLSKKFYPENLESYQFKSIYYNDICDFSLENQVNKFKESKHILNNKPANSLEDLGKAPNTNMEDVKLSQEILNSITDVNTIKKDLNLINSLNSVEFQPISKEIEMLNSVFNFTTRLQAYGNKTVSTVEGLDRKSKLLNDFMRQTNQTFNHKTKNKKHEMKMPSKAPTSLMTNNSKAKIEQKRDVLRRKTKVTNDSIIDAKLKQNINIPNVVNIDILGGNNSIGAFTNFNAIDEEDNYVEDNNSMINNDQVITDDINSFELPIDKVFQLNKKRTNENIMSGDTNNTNNNINNNNITNNNNNKNNNNNNNSNTTPVANNNTQNHNNKNLSNIENNSNIQSVPSSNCHINSIPSIPTIPNVPSISNNIQNTLSIPTVPGIPNISSSIPKIPVLSNLTQKAVITNNNANIPKAPVINIPIPKIKPLSSIPVKKADDKEENKKEEEKKEPIKPPPKDPVSAIELIYNFTYLDAITERSSNDESNGYK